MFWFCSLSRPATTVRCWEIAGRTPVGCLGLIAPSASSHLWTPLADLLRPVCAIRPSDGALRTSVSCNTVLLNAGPICSVCSRP